MKAGRIDIACQIVIMAFFISKQMRRNVKLHMIFNGPPDPPKHLELFPGSKVLNEDSISAEERDISKKDVAGLLKKLLYKYKAGIKNEVMPGYFVEKKGFADLVNDMLDSGKEVFILDKKGEDIRTVEISDKPVFILGDHDGIPKPEMKKLKKMNQKKFEELFRAGKIDKTEKENFSCIKKVSVGEMMYFASQTMTIVQNELDRRNIN